MAPKGLAGGTENGDLSRLSAIPSTVPCARAFTSTWSRTRRARRSSRSPHAAVAQFEDVEAIEHVWALVRTARQMERVLAEVEATPGVVIYTLVDPALRDRLTAGCQRCGVPCVPVLDPVLGVLSSYLGRPVKGQPGGQHALDAGYFQRMDAIQFVLRHDDGQAPQDLDEAHVVVVGVSRTSKTPTCFYLANRGLKAANVPVVPGMAVADELLHARRPLIVAFSQSPDRLVQVRRNRMTMLEQDGETDYVDPGAVRRRARLRPAPLRAPWLARDRRHPALHRGDRGRRHAALSGAFRGVAVSVGLVLASASLGRRLLLERAGVAFRVEPRVSTRRR